MRQLHGFSAGVGVFTKEKMTIPAHTTTKIRLDSSQENARRVLKT